MITKCIAHHLKGCILNPAYISFLMIVSAFTLSSSTSHAFRGDAHVWTGPSFAVIHGAESPSQYGASLQTGLQIHLSDFWRFVGGLEGSYHLARPGSNLNASITSGAFLGVRYAFDIVTYVPYAGIGATGYLHAPRTSSTGVNFAPGFKLTLGLSRRMSRNWSLSAQSEIHTLFSQLTTFPAYSTFGVVLGYHFRL